MMSGALTGMSRRAFGSPSSNVTPRGARTGVMLLVDVRERPFRDGGCSGFRAGGHATGVGSGHRQALAFSAIRDGDRVVGFGPAIVLNDTCLRGKTRAHVTRLLHELLFTEPKSQGTSITRALNFLNNLLHRPALVFVLSDFRIRRRKPGPVPLQATNQRHEVIALRTVDRRELELPDVGLALVQISKPGSVRTGYRGSRGAGR